MSRSGLISTSKETPPIRLGYPWTLSLEFSGPTGGDVFPSGATYSAIYKARSSGSVIVTGTVTRDSSTVITLALTVSNIATIVAALQFTQQGPFDIASVLIEVVRTDTDPDETTGIFIEQKVLK